MRVRNQRLSKIRDLRPHPGKRKAYRGFREIEGGQLAQGFIFMATMAKTFTERGEQEENLAQKKLNLLGKRLSGVLRDRPLR